MTPEELNRMIEFIIQHQANLEISLDREREERLARAAEHEQMTRNIGSLQVRVVELTEIQSRRLDRNDEEHRRFENWQRDFQHEAQRKHEESIARLDRILERLTGNN
jgi:UDP-N-acetylglucosamine 2-epimerase